MLCKDTLATWLMSLVRSRKTLEKGDFFEEACAGKDGVEFHPPHGVFEWQPCTPDGDEQANGLRSLAPTSVLHSQGLAFVVREVRRCRFSHAPDTFCQQSKGNV